MKTAIVLGVLMVAAALTATAQNYAKLKLAVDCSGKDPDGHAYCYQLKNEIAASSIYRLVTPDLCTAFEELTRL